MVFSRPKVLVSACLEFEKVRYNGQVMPSSLVRELEPFVDFIRVCPEVEIGLGVPREPIRIVKKGAQYRLIQHNTDLDVTDRMNEFSERFIGSLEGVDGFIFKSGSPSMGLKGIKVYSGMKGSPVIDKCGGFFASKAEERFSGHPMEEDDRLRNKRIRDHFLTALFLFAGYREAKEAGGLEAFHSSNKLLLDYYGHDVAGRMDPGKKGYFEDMKAIMRRPPDTEEIIRFFKGIIGEDDILDKYERNRVSLETLKEAARTMIKEEDVLSQTYFHPYPIELIPLADDDRDRDYWKQ